MPIQSPTNESVPQAPYTWFDEIEFIMEVEARWRVTIPDDDAIACHSLKQFADYVARAVRASGGRPGAAEILAEILEFASRHFAPLTITPEFDPVGILRGDLAESRAMAPYFRKLDRKRSLKTCVRKAGRGVVIFFAFAVYCTLFCAGVRLIIEQDSRLAATGCIIFVVSLHLPIIIALMVSARQRSHRVRAKEERIG